MAGLVCSGHLCHQDKCNPLLLPMRRDARPLICAWKTRYEFVSAEKNHMKQRAGFVCHNFFFSVPAISHVLSQQRSEKRRGGPEVNINFRSQNLSVWCTLKLSSSEKAAVLSYIRVSICLCVCVCVVERTPTWWLDDLMAFTLCMCVLQWPVCPLSSFLAWFDHGLSGESSY